LGEVLELVADLAEGFHELVRMHGLGWFEAEFLLDFSLRSGQSDAFLVQEFFNPPDYINVFGAEDFLAAARQTWLEERKFFLPVFNGFLIQVCEAADFFDSEKKLLLILWSAHRADKFNGYDNMPGRPRQ
jgi:hypothetical protein